jgi:hypothetical protein
MGWMYLYTHVSASPGPGRQPRPGRHAGNTEERTGIRAKQEEICPSLGKGAILGVRCNEEDLPAQQDQTQENLRFSRTHEDPRWQARSETQKGERQSETYHLG